MRARHWRRFPPPAPPSSHHRAHTHTMRPTTGVGGERGATAAVAAAHRGGQRAPVGASEEGPKLTEEMDAVLERARALREHQSEAEDSAHRARATRAAADARYAAAQQAFQAAKAATEKALVTKRGAEEELKKLDADAEQRPMMLELERSRLRTMRQMVQTNLKDLEESADKACACTATITATQAKNAVAARVLLRDCMESALETADARVICMAANLAPSIVADIWPEMPAALQIESLPEKGDTSYDDKARTLAATLQQAVQQVELVHKQKSAGGCEERAAPSLDN